MDTLRDQLVRTITEQAIVPEEHKRLNYFAAVCRVMARVYITRHDGMVLMANRYGVDVNTLVERAVDSIVNDKDHDEALRLVCLIDTDGETVTAETVALLRRLVTSHVNTVSITLFSDVDAQLREIFDAVSCGEPPGAPPLDVSAFNGPFILPENSNGGEIFPPCPAAELTRLIASALEEDGRDAISAAEICRRSLARRDRISSIPLHHFAHLVKEKANRFNGQ